MVGRCLSMGRARETGNLSRLPFQEPVRESDWVKGKKEPKKGEWVERRRETE